MQKAGAGVRCGPAATCRPSSRLPPRPSATSPYALLDGPGANGAVPGFPLDPRNGQRLAMLFGGVLGGSIAVGDTEVAGQALADGLQSCSVANGTTVWRKGSLWYVLRLIPKGATAAGRRSQLTTGNRQVFDQVAAGPAVLGADSIVGLHRLNAIGTPAGAFDGGGASAGFLQVDDVADPVQAGSLDPAGLRLVPVDGSGAPIEPEVIASEALGSVATPAAVRRRRTWLRGFAAVTAGFLATSSYGGTGPDPSTAALSRDRSLLSCALPERWPSG